MLGLLAAMLALGPTNIDPIATKAPSISPTRSKFEKPVEIDENTKFGTSEKPASEFIKILYCSEMRLIFTKGGKETLQTPYLRLCAEKEEYLSSLPDTMKLTGSVKEVDGKPGCYNRKMFYDRDPSKVDQVEMCFKGENDLKRAKAQINEAKITSIFIQQDDIDWSISVPQLFLGPKKK